MSGKAKCAGSRGVAEADVVDRRPDETQVSVLCKRYHAIISKHDKYDLLQLATSKRSIARIHVQLTPYDRSPIRTRDEVINARR